MRKSFITTAIAVGFAISAFAAAIPKNDYITRFSEIAIREKNQYGIPACISMAQGILESSWGEGKLAQKNNHFGIKCHNDWEGASFATIDDDRDKDGNLIESCFRAYDTVEESWRDHSTFLQKPRYQSLYDFGLNYRAWAIGLQAATYATDPEYAKKIIGIIERYELYKLDGLTEAIATPEIPAIQEGLSVPVEKQKELKKIKRNEENANDGTLFEITPSEEQFFDEKISDEEKIKPAAVKLPTEYLRGQGRKLLEGLFNNLKKTNPKKEVKTPTESEELDEMIPNNATQNRSTSFVPKGGIVHEKVVVMQ
jgi:Mannosyl-glycoprotein endo-beta-N-acetylglucosaminidase